VNKDYEYQTVPFHAKASETPTCHSYENCRRSDTFRVTDLSSNSRSSCVDAAATVRWVSREIEIALTCRHTTTVRRLIET